MISDATSVRSDASRTQMSDARSLSLSTFSLFRTQMGAIYRYTRNREALCSGVIHMQRIGGDRENAVFASSLGMTRFFASDVCHFASDASQGLGFCVRTSKPMQEVKLRFDQRDLEIVDRHAAIAGITRSALLRQRALPATSGVARLQTVEYHQLVSDAAAFMRGDLNHRHVETLIAYVITRLDQHSRQAAAGHQPTA